AGKPVTAAKAGGGSGKAQGKGAFGMKIRRAFVVKVVVLVAFGVGLVGVGFAAPRVKNWWRPSANEAQAVEERDPTLRLQLRGTVALVLPAAVVQALGLRTAEARPTSKARPLPPLAGSLALDANSLARVHTRFAGEVVAIGTTSNHETDTLSAAPTEF